MKQLLLLMLLILVTTSTYAQIVDIPDAWFKYALLNHNPPVDTNGDGEIQVSEAEAVDSLDLYYKQISDLTGINSFVNLQTLDCSWNDFTSLDVSNLPNLQTLDCAVGNLSSLDISNSPNLQILYCGLNNLSSLDISNSPNLQKLHCDYNSLTSLDVSNLNNLHLQELMCYNNNLTSLNVSNLPNLQKLWCYNNNLSSLDVSNSPNLQSLNCGQNNLTSLLIKNGSKEQTSLHFPINPNLSYICCDESQLEVVKNKAIDYGLNNCQVNTFCSFTPGGNYNTIAGMVQLDMNSNNCSENAVPLNAELLQVSDGANIGYVISNTIGAYNFYCSEGAFSLQPLVENPYFSIPTATVTFNTANNLISTQNFCITPNGTHHDLEITLLPENAARPGFDAKYQITYQNQGTQVESGSISLQFDDSVLDFVSASPNVVAQSDSLLTWNFVDLQPFESRSIAVTLNVNSPQETPAVNGGDVLSFLAYLNYAYTDETPEDNSSALRQTAVNSYDPNDKTCLQGAAVEVKNVDEYLDYVIRFQNTGSAEAINVIVTDELTANLDVSTFQMIAASHDYRFRLEGRTVEFYFENINLPDSTSNEPESHGFVAFKIKPKAVALGDKIENTAEIYFDYNFPIITNTTETEVIEDTAVEVIGLETLQSKGLLQITPNPASEYISLNIKQNIKQVEIYDNAGRLRIIQTSPDARINIQNLPSGVYTLKAQIGEQWYAEKFVVGR